ncbi:MAG: amidohydrolase family protein [Deltaproteobacteria bacterium]|nr:amidohydrolase family protein [Deltaproteobacteria bacterium]
MKIIDFRLRPPTYPYKGFFFKEAVYGCCRSYDWPVSPSYVKSLEGEKGATDDEALELLYKEMDEMDIEIGLMNGRHSDKFIPPCHVEDNYLAELSKHSKGRLWGLAGVNFDKPMNDIISGIEMGVKELGMKGACMEPGLASKPMYADDEYLMPIYKTLADLNLPLLFMTGPFSGPDISYTHPLQFERVAIKFPRLPIILGHACYPYVSETIALAFRSGFTQNIYVSPDVYMFAPGGSVYAEAINWQPTRYLFASAYPFGNLKDVIERTLALPIKKELLDRYMYSNAAKLLKL